MGYQLSGLFIHWGTELLKSQPGRDLHERPTLSLANTARHKSVNETLLRCDFSKGVGGGGGSQAVHDLCYVTGPRPCIMFLAGFMLRNGSQAVHQVSGIIYAM